MEVFVNITRIGESESKLGLESTRVTFFWRLGLENWEALTRLCDSGYSLERKFPFALIKKITIYQTKFSEIHNFILIEYTASERFFQELFPTYLFI
jgi:hypothetical protein